ncbi:mechanosensitive ion channel family protein [Bartonella sp. CB178]|uniref:mechanosensitive ion channel family protein n=1 Tax=Bartonella sp. CB178 TaxID=3112255 RepID=UPI00300DD0EC
MHSFFGKKLRVPFFTFLIIVAFFSCKAETSVPQDVPVRQSTTAHSINEIIQKQYSVIKVLEHDKEVLKKDFESKSEDEAALADLRSRARGISKRAIEGAFVLRAPLNDINSLLVQLEELGDDSKNSKIQIEKRNSLLSQKAKINSVVLRFEEIFLSTNKIAELTISQSRELLKRTLTYRSEFSMEMIRQFVEKNKEAVFDFVLLFSSWWEVVFYFKPLQLFSSVFIPIVSAFGLAFFSRKALARMHRRVAEDNKETSYLKRLLIAFISILLPSLVCAFCVYFTFFLFHSFGLEREKLTTVFHTVGHQIILVFLINRLASVLLSSKTEGMRLLEIAPSAASQLVMLLTTLGVILAFDAVLDSVYQVVFISPFLTIFKGFITVFLVAMLLFAISFVPLRFRHGYQDEKKELLFWPFYIRIPVVALGLLLIVTDILGYIGLAHFIMQQIVVGGAFLVLMYLGLKSTKAIGSKGEFVKTNIGHALMQRLHLENKTMDQLGIVISVFLNLVVIVSCTLPLLMQFGLSYSDLRAILWQLIVGFQIGNVSVSLISIATGICAFAVCFFLIRKFISWIDDVVLVRGEFDSGVRNSIKTVINYGGVVVSALIGLSTAGLDLRNFALIAGGLSLGIGFGLQNIVQNFVSGLIILVGRPFKLGDYVESGSVGGVVKRINVRATELETFQRKTVIIPNSSLINNNVINWTRRSKMGRVDIPVTVSSNISPERVVEILLEIASSTEGILKNPAPQVNFTAFDSKKFSFTLAVYVPNITSTSTVSNALRFVLHKRFAEEGILEC